MMARKTTARGRSVTAAGVAAVKIAANGDEAVSPGGPARLAVAERHRHGSGGEDGVSAMIKAAGHVDTPCATPQYSPIDCTPHVSSPRLIGCPISRGLYIAVR
jgi:hypothetical protein